ncbi:hypothetical protein [Arcobacter sp. LA11]|uniref:hypothetical protein n=1 Tax=Arcobacter sp. LA11 TaxID=1898176 RepID=UPI0009F8D803|nr:hypothetical protein [Arcobacter sp. LA11]
MINLKKEIVVFVVIFIVTSIVIHLDTWLSTPLIHLKALFSHPMPYHPLLYVFLIYIGIAILRGILSLILKLFKK